LEFGFQLGTQDVFLLVQ